MTIAYRIDRGYSLRAPRRTPQGFLRVDGFATRVGILEYADPAYPDRIRRELRLPEDVQSPESLATYEGAPITDDHPPAMLSPENARQYARGTVLAARADGEHVATDMQIADADLIGKVESGKRELSPGYRIRLEKTAGTHPLYGRYDVCQRDIVVNHLAIVERGRAGHSASIRFDGEEFSSGALESIAQVCIEHVRNDVKDPDKIMPDNTETLTALAKDAATEKARADSAEKKLADETKRADTAEGQVKGLQAEVEKLRAERTDAAAKDAEIEKQTKRADEAEGKVKILEADAAKAPEQIKSATKARVALVTEALRIVPDGRFDEMSDRDVMKNVLDKRGYTVEDSFSDEVVRGMFQVACKQHAAGDKALQNAAAGSGARTDAGAGTSKSARDEMIAAQNNAWRSSPST